MQRRIWWSAFVLLITLCGCPAANRYGTPRTMPAGTSGHVLSLDGNLLSDDMVGSFLCGSGAAEETGEPADDPCKGRDLTPLPFPNVVYTWRHGLAQGLELGVGAGTAPFLGLDLKVELLRSRYFDAAVAPTLATSFIYPSVSLPLLLGINLSNDVALLPQAGAHLFTAIPDQESHIAFWWSAGLGAQFRSDDDFALQPSLQWMASSEANILTAGLGLVWGPRPADPPPPVSNDDFRTDI
ncbi:hypothetical protein [Vulgatibacter sp.]|uniref:hypothetical protein n=1 Tax=Vulgatibacter sp. TaxID=1971226 RepID=UPI0035659290